MKSNVFWIVILGSVILMSTLAAFFLTRAPMSYAGIYQDGELIRTIDLSDVPEPYMFYATGDAGRNVISVEHGRISVFAASCPDLICVRRGWLSSGVVPIVCVPNRLLITLNNGPANNIDAVVG